MIENTKCECGHQNPVGTVLCESCGKPLEDDPGNTGPLEMRYDGVARRSQRTNQGLLDRVWSFFSSVKIAIYMILITLVLSMLGTIYPQENTLLNIGPDEFYEERYGTSGLVYYKLGLSHTFSSWWFMTLLFMIGTSLIVCSLDRVLPLYRALSKQQVRKHPSFLLRQKVRYEGQVPAGGDAAWVEQMAKQLRSKRYRVHIDGTALIAEKNRFSRWGPYINHIGLIVFLGAVLMRSIPGWHMDEYVGLLEGQAVPIPNTSYYMKNEKFTVEYYSEAEMDEKFKARDKVVPKIYETQAVLYRCVANCNVPAIEPQLEELKRQSILVNKPFDYKGFQAYQFDFAETPTLLAVNASITNKQTGESFGPFRLSMTNPESEYKAGPYTLKVKGYYPEFGLDDKGQPISKSNNPDAPAFIFIITGPNLAASGEPFLYFPREIDKQEFRQNDVNGAVGAKVEIAAGSMENVEIAGYTSYLNIRVDKAMPYIWTGAAISMLGLIMGFYWQHRRVWLRVDKGHLALGGHTNKNWYGIRTEVASALGKTGIYLEPKSLMEAGGNAS
ncbi:MAG: cytochrome c biogenesis protein ResB [Paenibacillaceae bacterium]|nr:cytochrome c biogenesis protein ResB [Paenibacillaceae bacterium]